MSECTTGTNIFSSNAGYVVAVDGAAAPVVFVVDGDAGLFHDLKAIVTSVGIQGQGGYQFMHTLREYIYVYVFTERVGEIAVSGLAFPAACDSFGAQGAQGCVAGTTGLERILTWYECNRITTRAAPVVISFGDAVIYDAFLVSCKADIVNAEAGIAQFTLRFNYIPNVNDDTDFCFPMTEEGCLDEVCTPDDDPDNPEDEEDP
jgi:hypothetical protein